MYAELAFLVPVLPFIAFLLTLTVWKRDRMWVGSIGIALMMVAFTLSMLILQEALGGAHVDETWAPPRASCRISMEGLNPDIWEE